MPSDRVADLDMIAGLAPSSFRPRGAGGRADGVSRPGASRFTAVSSGRGNRRGPAARGREDRGPPLPRVSLDGERLPRIQPAAVASALQLADLAVVLIAGAASFALLPALHWPLPFLPAAAAALVLALMTRGLASANPLTDPTRRSSARLFGAGIAHMLAAFGFALIAAVAVFQPSPDERAPLVAWLLVWALTASAGIAAARVVLSILRGRWQHAGRLKQLVAIYGTGDHAERLAERLRLCSETVEIVGVFDDRAGRGVVGAGLPALPHGTTDELVEMSRQLEIDRIVVALPHSAGCSAISRPTGKS